MQLRNVKCFCVVARLGSFTKAAQECFISQSAVSQQVKQLERDLGAELIRKRGRSFELTAAGSHFAAKAPAILDELERLQGETLDIALGNPTSLCVGYLEGYDGWEVAAAVSALKRRHPYAEINTVSGSHDMLYEELRLRRADVIFNDKRRAFSDEYVNRLIARPFEYIEVSEASALACGKRQVTAQELKGMPCIVIASQGQRSIEESHYRDVLNFECPMLFASSLREARMMVAADRGFLCVESSYDGERAEHAAIRRIPLMGEGRHLTHEYFAFYPAKDANPLASEFADILKGLFGK